MPENQWIDKPLVVAIHRRQLAEHGGLDGVRDEGMLDSALAKARNLLAYGGEGVDAPALAAAYAFGLARNHPFLDGNKRTALVVCRTFLLLNGHDIPRTSQEDRYRTFLALADGSLDEDALATWLRENLEPQALTAPETSSGP